MSDAPGSLSFRFRWILAGSVASAAAQWGVVMLLARYRGPEVLGAYALGLSLASVAFALGSLELRTLQVTDHTADTPFSAYFRLRLATSLAALGILTVLASMHSSFAATAIVVVAIGRGFEALSEIVQGRMQVVGRADRIGLSQIMRAVLALSLLTGSLALSVPPLVSIAAVAAANICVFFLFDVPGLRRHGAHTELWGSRTSGLDMALIRAGLPVAFTAMLVAASTGMPRFAVSRESGEAAVGVVAALSYLAVAPNLLVTALGQAGMRSLAGSVSAGDRRRSLRAAGMLLAMSATVGAAVLGAALFAGRAILQAAYGVRYQGYEWELTCFLGAGAIGYVNAGLGYCLSSARIFAPQIPMMAVVCAVSFIACTLLTRRLGIAGAALGQAVAYLVQLSWSAALVTQAYYAPPPRREALSAL